MLFRSGTQVTLSDEQFQEEMARRREKMQRTGRYFIIGCPLCNLAPEANAARATTASR